MALLKFCGEARMILALATLLLQFPAVPVANKPPQPVATYTGASATVSSRVAGAASASAASASAPNAANTNPASKTAAATNVTAPIHPASQPLPEIFVSAEPNLSALPVPAFRPLDERPMIRRAPWVALTIAEHSSASFDAFATRRAISNGKVEMDPLMRPFTNSSAIYGAIQVIPFGLDYVGRRWQRSSGWERHVWWLPQSLATATFLFSGSYDLAHSH